MEASTSSPIVARSIVTDDNISRLVDQRKLQLLEQRFSDMNPANVDENAEREPNGQVSEQETDDDGLRETSNDVRTMPGTLSDEGKAKRKRKHFTQNEDNVILEGYQKYGSNWDEIVKWGQLDRTGAQILQRWRRLTKKNNEDQQPLKFRKLDAPSPPLISQAQELASLRTDLEKERASLEEERERTKQKESILNEKEERLKQLEIQLNQKATNVQNTENAKLDKTRQALCAVIKTLSIHEKEIARQKLARDSERLGTITLQRHGTSFQEVFEEGQAFKNMMKKHALLLETRENVEKMKKEVAKKITNKKRNTNLEADSEMEELLQQDEILKIRLATLKKEESELVVEKDQLVVEKNVHIRELKRVHDEDQSRFNNHMILQNRYLLMSLLGKGGFSEVYKAYDIVELREVACKLHQLNTQWPDKKKENYIRHACREYNIHMNVVHPKIVQLFDVFEIDDNNFCTVLEFCNGNDLDFYLKTQTMLAEREAKSIVSQIFSGLKYLNDLKRPIIHYDLKPGNILFNNGEVKITDFGLSKIMDEDQDAVDLTSQGAGTYWYLPPECFETGKDPPKISSKVDVWSVGVIFYQMLYGKKPFGNNLSQQKILQEGIILNAGGNVLEFPEKPVVSTEAKNFIRKCLTRSQLERPDVKTCYNDPYLKLTVSTKKETKRTSSSGIPPPPLFSQP